MNHSADDIKALREMTGAGIVDVKQALDASSGDQKQAADILRRKGKQIAQKKASRMASEGTIGCYVHANGKVAALVVLACETDFVARNPVFLELAHDLALHVTAANPDYVSSDDVPPKRVEDERSIIREQMAGESKSDQVMEKILTGKLEKFYAEHCFLDQPFVKDDTKTIRECIEHATAKMGEKIEIRHFVRFQL